MEWITINLSLPHGDAKGLRICEIPNWKGKAFAAPKTQFSDLLDLLGKEQDDPAGVYFLFGTDPDSGKDSVYIGEAEVVRIRLKQHREDDFNSAVTFVSKDLTKAHVRYLENRLFLEAKQVGRYQLKNTVFKNPKLPEFEKGNMKVFLERVRLMLPVLGSALLTPVSGSIVGASHQRELLFKTRGAVARGRRTDNGFVVFKGSTAYSKLEPGAKTNHPYVVSLREKLGREGKLVERNDGLLEFAKDTDLSPSAAASVIRGGGVNGLTAWKDEYGKTLKELDAPPDEPS